MSVAQLRLTASRVHYAWIVAGVTFVVVLLTAGVRAAPGILIVPLEEEFHWSRAAISRSSVSLRRNFSTFPACLREAYRDRLFTALNLLA